MGNVILRWMGAPNGGVRMVETLYKTTDGRQCYIVESGMSDQCPVNIGLG